MIKQKTIWEEIISVDNVVKENSLFNSVVEENAPLDNIAIKIISVCWAARGICSVLKDLYQFLLTIEKIICGKNVYRRKTFSASNIVKRNTLYLILPEKILSPNSFVVENNYYLLIVL